ncbi:MAG: GTPase [Candidatus Aenigmatarchaeota archaeon]
MPINAGPEYYAAEKKYLEARTREEKIKALEEMIRVLPKHKGTSNLLAQLKHRLAKLKKEGEKKAKAKPSLAIKKEGAAQVCIIGLTNSGKSTLLKALTNAKVEIADYPFTTKKPEVGMMQYTDLQLQLVEIPSTFNPEFLTLLHTCDEILILLDATKDLKEQEQEINNLLKERNLLNKKFLWVLNKSETSDKDSQHLKISAKEKINLEILKEKIWEKLDLIRVYTKSPGKPKDLSALALPKGSTVKDVAKILHKDFLKNFKYARIFNNTKFSGQKVGLDYELKDFDVVEIHTR